MKSKRNLPNLCKRGIDQKADDCGASIIEHVESWATDFAAQRAVNTKEHLVPDKGIDPSRVIVARVIFASGTSESRMAEDYRVPAGATFTRDVQGSSAVDETW
jgi:hypothetical protein